MNIIEQTNKSTALMTLLGETDMDYIDKLLEDAISTDGRGHFLASYDGKEHELTIEDTYYYIYRLN